MDAAEALTEKINNSGFSALVKSTGMDGMVAFRQYQPALVVLDLQLPDMDGLDICRMIRQETMVTPIIILTARAEEADRIVGLELGADDYVSKPFSPKEVLSRIRSILRRVSAREITLPALQAEPLIYQASGITLDDARHEVLLEGRSVRLSPTEYKLLSMLMRQAGNVVSREKLVDELWGYDGFSANLLEIHVGKLRRKLEDNPRRPRRILTVRSFGYKVASDSMAAAEV